MKEGREGEEGKKQMIMSSISRSIELFHSGNLIGQLDSQWRQHYQSDNLSTKHHKATAAGNRPHNKKSSGQRTSPLNFG